MNKVAIFNGFQTITFYQDVANKYTFQRHGCDVMGGTVQWEGKEIHVEWVGDNDWWGRTTSNGRADMYSRAD